MTIDAATYAQILQIETLSANAWPATEVVALDGWRLRYTDGVTKRANSVWPNASPVGGLADEPLAEKLAAVEAFYRARALPARYQIAPVAQPIALDDQLADRGYAAVARTSVQVAAVATVLAWTTPLRQQPEFAVEVSERFDEGWFAAYGEFAEEDRAGFATRRTILQRIEPATGFALLQINGQPAAVGLGVVEAGWVGIFCMGTAPAFRRRGAARAILRTLAIWGQLYGAEQVYLQVIDSNRAARPLYERVGFVPLYHYHYREQQIAPE